MAANANTATTASMTSMVRSGTSPSQSTVRMPTAQMSVVPRSDCALYRNSSGKSSTPIWTTRTENGVLASR